MAATPNPSPPRKRAKLSLKFMRKDQHPVVDADQTETEPSEVKENEDTSDNLSPYYGPYLQQPSTHVPSKYVVTVAPYTGLHNLGNTCYLNSVLQVLRYCPDFRQNLSKLACIAGEILTTERNDSCDGRVTGSDGSGLTGDRRKKEFRAQLELVQKLNKLFSTMSEKERSYRDRMMPSGQELAMYPEDLLEAIRELNPMFRGYLQHDAQELLCCILSNVQEACQGLCRERRTPPVDDFRGRSLNCGASDAACLKAARKLNMNHVESHPGSVGGEVECGRLRGGGRPKSVKNVSYIGLVDESKNVFSPFKSQRSNGGDVTDSTGNDNGLSGLEGERHCNGTDIGSLKVKKGCDKLGNRLAEISPSSDSVRRRSGKKKNVTNGHVSERECHEASTGMDGGGDGSSLKKKRLGIGRIVPNLQKQPTILSKFGILKKEKSESHADQESHSKDSALSDGEQTRLASPPPPQGGADCTPDKNSQSCPENKLTSNSNLNHRQGEPGQKLATADEDKTLEVIQEEPLHPTDYSVTPSAAVDLKPDTAAKQSQVSCSSATEGTEASEEMRLVERLFQGNLVLRTRCQECESSSERREDFQDISVPVQSVPQAVCDDDEEQPPDVNPRNLSLTWALSEFASVERLTDDNKYYCEHCYHHTEAERSVLFGRLPGILIIQLKRFSALINCFSPGGSVSKVNDHLAVPLTLSLAKWCASACRKRDDCYELCAIVAHSGVSSSSGHYVAYAKVPQEQMKEADSKDNCRPSEMEVTAVESCAKSSESWAHFDDDRVHVMSDEEFSSFLNPLPGSDAAATPYLLFYRQIRP